MRLMEQEGMMMCSKLLLIAMRTYFQYQTFHLTLFITRGLMHEEEKMFTKEMSGALERSKLSEMWLSPSTLEMCIYSNFAKTVNQYSKPY